ncbi:MAG: recombinase family protein [Nocardioidaceae bacterium]
MPAIGYATVPRAGGIDHPELVAQAQAIARACERHDLALVGLIRDAEPPDGGPVRRPGLTHALRRIASGEADALVVSSLDRLSDSPAGRGRLLEWLDERRARLVVADADLDTGSSAGRLEARALVGVEDGGREEPPEPHHEPSAQAEARRVEPTHTTGGATTVGSRRTETGWTAQEVSELKARIASMRAAGMTLQAIADQLNAERVPTLRGGAQWRPSSVQATTGYKRPRRAGQKRAGPKRDGGEAAGPGGDGSRRGRE